MHPLPDHGLASKTDQSYKQHRPWRVTFVQMCRGNTNSRRTRLFLKSSSFLRETLKFSEVAQSTLQCLGERKERLSPVFRVRQCRSFASKACKIHHLTFKYPWWELQGPQGLSCEVSFEGFGDVCQAFLRLRLCCRRNRSRPGVCAPIRCVPAKAQETQPHPQAYSVTLRE